MMHAAFTPPGVLLVDHQAALLVAAGMNRLLYTFDHRNVLAIDDLAVVLEHRALGGTGLADAHQVERLARPLRTVRNHVEDEEVRPRWPRHEQRVRPQHPDPAVLDRIVGR